MFHEENSYARAEKYLRTTGGCIHGRLCTSVYDHNYYSFERIPYAEPPIGELRFKAPVPVKPWCSLLDCTQPAEPPLQFDFRIGKLTGSEDCLFVNVYVKKFNTALPLPVMVYLFEGGFERGNPTRTSHGPDYFMSRNIVLVTIGYRLGALGFLSFADPALDCPGNAGLKDQLVALKWVKENAKIFNGDPKNITLFGCSAGAASAHYLLMSPLAKGLFHKVILQSGTALSPWALNTIKNVPFRLATAVGYNGPNCDKNIFEFLKTIPGEQLVQVYLLTAADVRTGHILPYGPVVEPYKTANCMIPYVPEVLITKAWGNQIPMMIGANSNEGLMLKYLQVSKDLIEIVKADGKALLPRSLRENLSVGAQDEAAKRIRELHFGDDPANFENSTMICEFISFQFFWHSIYQTIVARQRYSYARTYVYRFDFDSPTFNLSRLKHCPPSERGVTHCDELGYLFFRKESWKLERNTCEFQNIRRMIAIWTRFAMFSDPNCKNLTYCQWLPIERDENEPIRCFNISFRSETNELPEFRKLRAWNDLYKGRYDYDED